MKKDILINYSRFILIAVLDGVVWFQSNTHMYNTVKKNKNTALSALLLKEYIETLVTKDR